MESYEFNIKDSNITPFREYLIQWPEFCAGLTARVIVDTSGITLKFIDKTANPEKTITSYDITGTSNNTLENITFIDSNVSKWNRSNNPLDVRRIYVSRDSQNNVKIKPENIITDTTKKKSYLFINCDAIRYDKKTIIIPKNIGDEDNPINRFCIPDYDSSKPIDVLFHIKPTFVIIRPPCGDVKPKIIEETYNNSEFTDDNNYCMLTDLIINNMKKLYDDTQPYNCDYVEVL